MQQSSMHHGSHMFANTHYKEQHAIRKETGFLTVPSHTRLTQKVSPIADLSQEAHRKILHQAGDSTRTIEMINYHLPCLQCTRLQRQRRCFNLGFIISTPPQRESRRGHLHMFLLSPDTLHATKRHCDSCRHLQLAAAATSVLRGDRHEQPSGSRSRGSSPLSAALVLLISTMMPIDNHLAALQLPRRESHA